MNDRQYQRLDRRLDAVEAREGLLAAEFLQTATSTADKLTVTVPSYDDGEHAFGLPEGVVWWPGVSNAGAAVFPSAGDVAYVMEANDGRWIVVSWTPA